MPRDSNAHDSIGGNTANPEWAPPTLVRRYQIIDEDLSNASHGDRDEQRWALMQLDVSFRLITDLRLKSVWTALRGRHHMSDVQIDQLVDEAVRSLLVFDTIPRRTRAKRRANLSAIAKLARNLEARISRDLGRQSARASAYLDTHHLSRSLQRAGLQAESRELVDKSVWKWLSTQRRPTFSDILDDLELAAMHAAQITPLLRKPRSKKAKGHYLALQLSAFFKQQFGSPLDSHVATITSVLTGLEIEPETVRKIRPK